jgi:mannose-6-phosphate isomerase-like protein (cupin superfamily)
MAIHPAWTAQTSLADQAIRRCGSEVATISAGFPGPSLHHHDFDETFYILEGELTSGFFDSVFPDYPEFG